jgi:hypothetical protein
MDIKGCRDNGAEDEDTRRDLEHDEDGTMSSIHTEKPPT